MRWLIIILTITSNSAVWAKERSPFYVEVKKEAVVLLPDSEFYSDVFSDEEKREIVVGNIGESKDFRKLLDYVTSHIAKSGLLRRRRDTIINFLIRPEGVETYREAKQVVDKFEKEHEKRLAISMLPNGALVVESLSGKLPYLGGDFKGDYSGPKDLPRSPKNGLPILQQRNVLVRNGKVIPFIDTGRQMETSLKNKMRTIIEQNNIHVEDERYITDEKQAAKVIDEFNEEQIGNKHFEVKLVRNGSSISFTLTPTDECGEEPDKAVRGFFAGALRNMQGKYSLRYLVEPNSFEAYKAIREYTDTRGFYAGWTIIDPGTYTHMSWSGYRIGEKPRPRPPRPAPGGPPPLVKGVLD